MPADDDDDFFAGIRDLGAAATAASDPTLSPADREAAEDTASAIGDEVKKKA